MTKTTTTTMIATMKTRVALLQLSYVPNMIEKTTQKIKEAALSGARLICLQELSFYPYFCQIEDPKFFDLAENYSNDLEIMRQLSEELEVIIVASLFEKRAKGLYHNTTAVLENGKNLGIYRKMHIPDDPNFYEKFYFTGGDINNPNDKNKSAFSPIETSIGKLGILICWDQWYVEASRIMALNGADILIYPTAIGHFDEDSKEEIERQKDAWITINRSHAIANGLFVLSVNRVGFEPNSHYLEGANARGINFFGSSMIIGPQGEIIESIGDNEGIITASIDLDRIEEVRRMWPFFRDRRIEAYLPILARYGD